MLNLIGPSCLYEPSLQIQYEDNELSLITIETSSAGFMNIPEDDNSFTVFDGSNW